MPGTGTDLTCAEMLRLKLSEAVQIAKGAEMENERLTRERDEARADVAHFRQLYLDAINRQASCCRSITRNAQVAARRIHEIRVRLLHAEAERDEARADAERLRALLPPEELLERAREAEVFWRGQAEGDLANLLRDLLAHFPAPEEPEAPALPEGPEARSTCGRLTAPFSVTAADYPYHVGDDSPAPEEPESAPEAPAQVAQKEADGGE
jgi:hypothetical protein